LPPRWTSPGGNLQSGGLLRITLLAEQRLRFIMGLFFCASELAACGREESIDDGSQACCVLGLRPLD